ncbi:MAG: carbamoyltransferase [Planctomycetota bacterium]|nr:carbamoyltransferase [Planctomycetota bacterium]
MTWILGLNVHHADSSAAIVQDGRIVAAAEEERFNRTKHWSGFPAHAIRYCLAEAGVRLEDVDHVAVNRRAAANLRARAAFLLRHRPPLGALLARLRDPARRDRLARELAGLSPRGRLRARIHAVEHHLAHLASAALVAPFERCVAVSVDQFGDFASTAWGVSSRAGLAVEGRVSFPHSLGTFYSAVTQLLGFPTYGDEYKVMGLASYGRPVHLAAMRDVVRVRSDGTFELELAFFRHHTARCYSISPAGVPVVDDLFSPELERLLGPRRPPGAPLEERHRDIARSAQAMYEEALLSLLRHLHRRHGLDDLALAGGCAMNSVANGRITRETPFRRIYVQAAAGDAGGAIGAAVALARRLDPGLAPSVMHHAYLGPACPDDEVEALLAGRRDRLLDAGCAVERVDDEEQRCLRIARALVEGRVVGWFQGRMEWGPRALGNRSILGDPRRADMKDILNSKIKRRESFRPFAPSILREAVADWFEVDADVPFMSQVLPIRPERRALIPAVTHVDGTGRLQTVRRQDNPIYHRLICSFRDLTGVPMVLNTSFNENEPVVCRPEEALDCFLRTRMDVLALGPWLVHRLPEG